MLINKIFFIAAMAVFLGTAIPATAAPVQKQTAGKAGEQIPEKALQPGVQRAYFEKTFRDFVMRLNRRIPQSLEAYKKADKKSYALITSTYWRSQMKKLYKVVTNPDLEEVTGNRRDWYRNLYLLLNKIESPVKALEQAIRKDDADAYYAACVEYDRLMNEVSKAYNTRPIPLSPKEYQAFRQANRERRQQEYLQKQAQQAQFAAPQNQRPAKRVQAK